MLDRIKDLIDPPLRGRKVFFLHIPKCGGTSVNRAIVDLYKPWRGGRANTVLRLREPAAREAEDTLNLGPADLRTPLLAYFLAAPDHELVLGHFFFSEAIFHRTRDKWDYVTVIRDPVDRWLSHYYYNKDRPQKYEITAPIKEFARSERGRRLGSPLVAMMTEDPDQAHVRSPESIDKTISLLRQFAVVGRTEDLSGFADDFENRIGKRPKIQRLNVGENKKKFAKDDLDNELTELLDEICAPDIAVYNALFKE